MRYRKWARLYLGALLSCSSGYSQVKTSPPVSLPGTDGKVVTLAYCQGILYAGGEFTIAGSSFARNIAKWDGKEWSTVGEGFDCPITKLGCDAQGNLYAAGHQWTFVSDWTGSGYKVDHPGIIKVWSGNAWRTIGTLNPVNAPPGSISGMAIDSKGRLYVSGGFESIDKTKAMNIAWWDGNAWHRLGNGNGFPIGPGQYSGDAILNIAIDKGDILYGLNLNRIGAWNPKSGWSMVGDTLSLEPWAVFLAGDGRPGAVGRFRYRKVGEGPLALYDGKAWQFPIDATGFHGSISSQEGISYLERANSAVPGKDGVLYVSTFSSVYTVKNGEMRRLGDPDGEKQIAGNVLALIGDSEGNLYAAGEGVRIGGSGPPLTVVRWDGKHWGPLTSTAREAKKAAAERPAKPSLPPTLTIPASLNRDSIKSIALAPDGQIYISGSFQVPSGKEFLNRLARWDGKTWRAVGPGLSAPAVAMAADRFGNLYAAGVFPYRDWVEVLLRWDGSSWKDIIPPQRDIRSLACDASGYLYVGTAGKTKDRWPGSLTRWDDSTFTALFDAPMGGATPFGDEPGFISQLDVIDTLLHVQGGFNKAGGKLTSGYAVFPTGPPDSARIRAKQAAMRRNAARSPETALTARLESSECRLGKDRVFRLEKVEISNWTAAVFDSVIFHAPDTAGFQVDAAITAQASGYRFAFPLGRLLPRDIKTITIGRTLRRVTPVDRDSWVYKDTLKPLLPIPALQFGSLRPWSDPNPGLRIALVGIDSFSVIRGAYLTDNKQLEVSGKPAAAFEIGFATALDFDEVSRAILAFIRGNGLMNAYLPPPVALLEKAKGLPKVKQDLLGRELLKWALTFEKPFTASDLYSEIGEGEDTVPDSTELKRRFQDISLFYLSALAVVRPSLEKETLAAMSGWIANWRHSECADETSISKRKETDFIVCNGEPGYYPMALIVNTLKLFGPGGKKDLESFYRVWYGGR